MNPLKFDRTRNSQEMGELFDYIVCLAVGGAVGAVLGLSWVAAFVFMVWALKMWKAERKVMNSRIRVLAVVASLLFLVLENWSAYCEGVSKGYEAAGMTGGRTACHSVPPGPETGQRG